MSHAGHDQKQMPPIHCAVITVSDTRTDQTDKGGPLIADLLAAAGHRVLERRIIPDDAGHIRACIDEFAGRKIEAIILTGGTGIAPRDVTYEAVLPLLDKRLEGFAELFRLLSFEQVGPRAMLSRALAGTRGSLLIFSLPGAPDAVRLAMERLILPVLPHAAALLRT